MSRCLPSHFLSFISRPYFCLILKAYLHITRQQWFYLLALMLAGESIYLLPYLRKSFQTSIEVTFALSATEVGTLNSLFGILAMLSYFPGGWLADRFPARDLLAVSLISTGVAGFTLLVQPGYPALLALHAFWGISSVLTFWAALIKATRLWGNQGTQGLSFGLLDGGRGAVAALLASVGAALFASAATPAGGLQRVVWLYALAPLLTGLAFFAFIPRRAFAAKAVSTAALPQMNNWRAALRLPAVWLLCVLVFCAYWLYVGSFDFPAFAEKAYGKSKAFGATLGAVRDWMRPLGAVMAGLLADRFRPSSTMLAAFALLVLSFGALALVPPVAAQLLWLWLPVLTAALAVFALRGVYFAALQEGSVPAALTGVSVGIVSLLGYLPDVFAHLLSGWFTSTWSGALGYRYYFALLSAVAFAGGLAAWQLRAQSKEVNNLSNSPHC